MPEEKHAIGSGLIGQEREPIRVKEVDALMGFAARQGIDTHGAVLGPLHEVMTRVASDPAGGKEEDRRKVFIHYASLTKLTLPVTGKTLLDSVGLDDNVRGVRYSCYVILLAVAASTGLKAWLGDQPEPEEGWLLWVMNFNRYVVDFLSPFLWGALGSFVYLLKHFSDLAADRKFDRDLLQGWETRVILGAVLGGVVQFVYDPSVFTSAGLQLDANALGFLTGIGVKIVYGAIEKTIQALGTAMNLDALRTTDTDTTVRRYLNEQLAKLGSSEGGEQRRETLLALLTELKDEKKQS